MAGHPAEFAPDTFRRSVLILVLYYDYTMTIYRGVCSVPEGALPHEKCYFRFFMVFKDTTFVIHVYYMYIAITLHS